MKAFIVSDSHGLQEELKSLKEMYQDKVDVLFHCGDSELPYASEEVQGYQIVRGNCDYFEGQFPNDIIHDVDGVRFFVTHGHLYDVKSSVNRISYRAREVEANIVCFGHSHIRGAALIDGILYLNPGSIRLPKKYIEKTYVLLEVEEEIITVQFFDMDHKEVEKIVFHR